MRNALAICLVVLAVATLNGCGEHSPEPITKSPRPVSVQPLSYGAPPVSRRVAGSVVSWKTEQLGFEVDGRVRWIVEPGTDIEGRVLDSSGHVVSQGTALGQIDAERYELAVAAAEANVEVAELNRDGIEISLKQGLPAEIDAAEAEVKLAEVEYKRIDKLVGQNAAARADLDQVTAQLNTARANLASLEAKLKQTEAQLNAAIASVNQANQQLKDARRSLADTTLYSSFRGQVADVSVVPGSLARAGSAAITVQMMDPIKVEIPLSAEQSRLILRRANMPVYVAMPDGSESQEVGFVYLIAPAADASTRTFTLELLLLNRKLESAVAELPTGPGIGRVEKLLGMDFKFLPDAPEGTYYVGEKAIRKDVEGYYVWIATNAKIGTPIPKLVDVKKLRVTPGEATVPFIGNLTLRTVTILEGQDINPSAALYVGELLVDDGAPDDWDGTQVVVTLPEQWMLRPGDVVTVDLNATQATDGYYVPMSAIYEESGGAYIFTVDETDAETIAKRVPIQVKREDSTGASSYRRIEFEGDALPEGTPVIVEGVHFLRDGERVKAQSGLDR